MLNRITIMGRLVANPELRYTPQGDTRLLHPHRLRPGGQERGRRI